MPSMTTGEIITQQKPVMEVSSTGVLSSMSSIPSPPRSLSKVVPVTAPRSSSEAMLKVNEVTPEHHIPPEMKSSDRKHAPLLPKASPMYRPPSHSRENDHRYVNPPPYPGAYPHNHNWYASHPPPGPPAHAHSHSHAPHGHAHPAPPRYPPPGSAPAAPTTSSSRRNNRFHRTSNQGESTLSALTERFIQLLDDYSTNHGEGELDLNIAVQELGVQKRRLYDITNVLEGVGLIKKDRNQVAWADRSQLTLRSGSASAAAKNAEKENESHKTAAMAALKTEIDALRNHGSYIDTCIEKLSNNVREYTKCRKESTGSNNMVKTEDDNSASTNPSVEESNLFVTKRQITALQAYHNDTVIAIRAPSGTSLEVPNPDEGMRPGVRRFQIFLTSPGPEAGEVKVMQVQSSNGTHSYQRHAATHNHGHSAHGHYPYYPPWGYHAHAPPPYPPPPNGPPHSHQHAHSHQHQHHPPSMPPSRNIPLQQPTKSSNDSNKHNSSQNNDNNSRSKASFQSGSVKEEDVNGNISIPKSDSMGGRDLPRLPIPHLQRPREMDRRASTSDVKSGPSPRKRRQSSMSSYPQIPPRPSLQRRSTEPFGADASALGLPYPKVSKGADGSRKPLKAALKSPYKNQSQSQANYHPNHHHHQQQPYHLSSSSSSNNTMPSPIKSSRATSMQPPPMSPKKTEANNNNHNNSNPFPCPSPTGRSNELMTAPLHSPSPCFNEAFLASPIPTSRLHSTIHSSSNGGRFSFCPTSPFPSFSPGIGLSGGGAPEFSPFIASPSIARMEREMGLHVVGDKSSPGSSKIPSLF